MTDANEQANKANKANSMRVGVGKGSIPVMPLDEPGME